MKVGTGSEYFVHVIIIVLLVIIIAMLLMQGQKKERFDMENFACGPVGNAGAKGGCNPNHYCKGRPKEQGGNYCVSTTN